MVLFIIAAVAVVAMFATSKKTFVTRDDSNSIPPPPPDDSVNPIQVVKGIAPFIPAAISGIGAFIGGGGTLGGVTAGATGVAAGGTGASAGAGTAGATAGGVSAGTVAAIAGAALFIVAWAATLVWGIVSAINSENEVRKLADNLIPGSNGNFGVNGVSTVTKNLFVAVNFMTCAKLATKDVSVKQMTEIAVSATFFSDNYCRSRNQFIRMFLMKNGWSIGEVYETGMAVIDDDYNSIMASLYAEMSILKPFSSANPFGSALSNINSEFASISIVPPNYAAAFNKGELSGGALMPIVKKYGYDTLGKDWKFVADQATEMGFADAVGTFNRLYSKSLFGIGINSTKSYKTFASGYTNIDPHNPDMFREAVFLTANSFQKLMPPGMVYSTSIYKDTYGLPKFISSDGKREIICGDRINFLWQGIAQ